MHQRGGRGKPLRLICLPAQLDYFLSGQPPAGSAPPPQGVQECLPPARQLAHTTGGATNGMETLRAWVCKRPHLLVCGRCYGLCFEQNKPFDSWETDSITTHFAEEKTEI